MNDPDFYENNLEAVKKRFPHLEKKIREAKESSDYGPFQISKTGICIPCLKNGNLLHSKYNPEREAKRFFSSNEGFILFCGLGSGIHIHYFLYNFKNNQCAACESDFGALKILLQKIDFTSIFLHPNFTLLPPLDDFYFEKDFIGTYLPILHGSFKVKILRAWEDYYANRLPSFQKKIESGLCKIKNDTATQAAFGKIWMRNILLNLKTASDIQPKAPKPDRTKTAYILGAGPSLENTIKIIKQNRNDFVLFASDTAFPVLTAHGIYADFFISIDPQAVSYSHCFKPFSSSVTGIFDLCANPLTVRTFLQNGNKILFTAGAHPFAQYAASFSPFPYCNTSSGTVAGAAKYSAFALGFKNIQFAGLDFAYTDGKAYSKGTYLSKLFFKEAVKISPIETKFCNVMFRTAVEKKNISGKITYTTELLNGYKSVFRIIESVPKWKDTEFKKFPYSDFIFKIRSDAQKNAACLKTVFLPYLIYKTKIAYNVHNNKKEVPNLELILSEFERYIVE